MKTVSVLNRYINKPATFTTAKNKKELFQMVLNKKCKKIYNIVKSDT